MARLARRSSSRRNRRPRVRAPAGYLALERRHPLRVGLAVDDGVGRPRSDPAIRGGRNGALSSAPRRRRQGAAQYPGRAPKRVSRVLRVERGTSRATVLALGPVPALELRAGMACRRRVLRRRPRSVPGQAAPALHRDRGAQLRPARWWLMVALARGHRLGRGCAETTCSADSCCNASRSSSR